MNFTSKLIVPYFTSKTICLVALFFDSEHHIASDLSEKKFNKKYLIFSGIVWYSTYMLHPKSSSLMLALSGSIISVLLFVVLSHASFFDAANPQLSPIVSQSISLPSAPDIDKIREDIRHLVANNHTDIAKDLYTELLRYEPVLQQ